MTALAALALALALPCAAADRVSEAFVSVLTPEQSARVKASSPLEDLAAVLTSGQKSHVRARLSRLSGAGLGAKERVRLEKARALLEEGGPSRGRRSPRPDSARHAAVLANLQRGGYGTASRLASGGDARLAFDGGAEGTSAVAAAAGTSRRAPVVAFKEKGLSTHSVPEPIDARSAPALALLDRSPTGREVADFLRKNKVPIKFVEIEEANVSAYYNPDTRSIEVPPGFYKKPTTEQAVVLGHEGFHAIQDLRRRDATCLEMEQDAHVRHLIMYHEMLAAGVEPLPARSAIAMEYAHFRYSAKSDRVQSVYDKVQKKHAERDEMDRLVNPWSALISAVFPMDLNSHPAAELRGKRLVRWRLGGEQGLINAQKDHAEERRWAEQWLKEHRKDFSRR